MPRYKLTVEYDGRPYKGWQRQDHAKTVQGEVERAVKALSGETVTLQVAGRTDTGVHALGQVAHVDLNQDYPAYTVRDAINAHLLPEPVAIVDCEQVDADFHARFSATGRRYLYRICNRKPPLAVNHGLMWRVPYPLDAEAMQAAADRLVGHHDFTTFRHAQCQAQSPEKTLDELSVERLGDEIRVTAASRSFLHRQVRSMVGTLTEVGRGAWTPDDVTRVLAARDRAQCGVVAPPDGLYLVGVSY